MARKKPVGWKGESMRHSMARRGIRTVGKSKAWEKGFKQGVIDSVGEKRIADLTEVLENRVWDRMGEYGFAPEDYKDVKDFEREFDEWWDDGYDEVGGEVAHEFDLEPSTQDDLAIEVLTDIIHNRIDTSIMNSMDEMIRFGPEGRHG